MRSYRCFSSIAESPGTTVDLEEEEAHHLTSVRRSGVGSEVVVVNGRGMEFHGVVESTGKRSATVRLLTLNRSVAQGPGCVLAMALTKSAAFEDTLQRAVELGMTHFVALSTERTVVEGDEKRFERKLEKWRRHGVESLKQCERLWLPEFEAPVSLGEALKGHTGAAFMLGERDLASDSLAKAVGRLRDESVMLLVGPEGGWTPGEVAEAKECGAQVLSLGQGSVLRTETAALAGLSLVMALRPRDL